MLTNTCTFKTAKALFLRPVHKLMMATYCFMTMTACKRIQMQDVQELC